MSTAVIPKFIEQGGILLTDAHAHRLIFSEVNGARHVTGVEISPHAGEGVTIPADRFILASGAYASTKLLWESDFTGATDRRTVGKQFTCNFGSPVIGSFPSKQLGWAGQQVGYLLYVPQERLVLETAFAPPGILGSLAPQLGAEFMHLVRSYHHITVIAPTVSSYAYGEIRKGNLFNSGYLIDWSMNNEDWRRLAFGMKLAARTFFSAGATEVLTTRFDARRMTSPGEIDSYFDGMGPADYFKVESSHPAGGNVIHPDPRLGVVDEHLKAHGIDNLWITDASVIPASITLNLQFTVMALARYAVPGILRR
jgi:choline dehydrogenase-like flavoprotein